MRKFNTKIGMNTTANKVVVYFDQRLEYAAPKRWSKYTTQGVSLEQPDWPRYVKPEFCPLQKTH